MSSLYDKTVRCIRCGFCLEACPTFVITGRETESPRGRIYLVRSAIEGQLDWNREVVDHLDTCLGCRACEPACPSGVEYGSILEMAREQIEKRRLRGRKERFARGTVLKTLTNPQRLKLSLLIPGRQMPGFLSRAISREKQEADKPISETGGVPASAYPRPTRRVHFLEGCVMSAMFKRTNAITIHLLRLHGCDVVPLSSLCCGALALHTGDADMAKRSAEELIAAAVGDDLIITNSAGCGSAMKEYADPAFAGRVRDITEFLYEIGFKPPDRGPHRVIAYHDACHLAHAQGIREQPRALLRSLPNTELVELGESDRCCGSAGIYNVAQPALARELLERKWKFIEDSGAGTVATGNPGCLAWIRQAAREKGSEIRVMHTVEALLEVSSNP